MNMLSITPQGDTRTDFFSVPIFFIIFRETLEASIIISVLLSLVEQIVCSPPADRDSLPTPPVGTDGRTSRHSLRQRRSEREADDGEDAPLLPTAPANSEQQDLQRKSRDLLKKLRLQILVGAALGFLAALSIGAALIAIFYTELADRWSKAEELWEGVFSLVASGLILVMALALLRMDRAKAKWRIKLQRAFEGGIADASSKAKQYGFFALPFITVLREGLESVVFVFGFALSSKPTAIPLAVFAGIAAGFATGSLIYASASRTSLTVFLVASTNLLLLIGAGLLSNAVGAWERYKFNLLVGGDAAESGNGPGSYDVDGNIWHLDCCNPEDKQSGKWWSVFAVFGWSNNASVGTISSYIFYWVVVLASLLWMAWIEGRITIFGRESPARRRRRAKLSAEAAEAAARAEEEQAY